MSHYRVEAYRLNALGVHEPVDFLEYEAVDSSAARSSADDWLEVRAFAHPAATNAQILIGDKIVAKKEIGSTVWDT